MDGGSICVALKVVDELSGRVCGKNCSIGMSLPSIKCRIQYAGILPSQELRAAPGKASMVGYAPIARLCAVRCCAVIMEEGQKDHGDSS